jgi:hypothetical protein
MSNDKDRYSKTRAKLAGEGIESKWTSEALSYMKKYGYSLNQISTKVAPYIRDRIQEESELKAQKELERAERNAQRDLEKSIKLNPIKEQYLKLRNRAFSEIYSEINQKNLNINDYKKISEALLAKKIIILNKWTFKKLFSVFINTGIIYGLLYWIFDSVSNASQSTTKIIIGVICAVVSLPKASSMTSRPIELQTGEVFRGTNFSINDLDSSITECDDNILKLIKCSLDGNKSEFLNILKKCTVPLVTAPVTPPPLPGNSPHSAAR